jgi:Putative serine esterase (DUF676)
MAVGTAHFIIGRTGRHLFLTDGDDGNPPLLVRMTEDQDDLKFMSVFQFLKLFRFLCCIFFFMALFKDSVPFFGPYGAAQLVIKSNMV